jgi:hypothetical protein
MPGSRDKLITEAELDLAIRKLIKRMASAGGGGEAVNIIISDDHPTPEDGADGYIWLEY